jgi:putative transcriptional regulator
MRKQHTKAKRRDIFGELMSGVAAMREHREGRLTLREHHVEPLRLPRVSAETVRETRRRLGMSRSVFAYRLGVNVRTIERWETGRSQPNEQAAALVLSGPPLSRHAGSARVSRRDGVASLV